MSHQRQCPNDKKWNRSACPWFLALAQACVFKYKAMLTAVIYIGGLPAGKGINCTLSPFRRANPVRFAALKRCTHFCPGGATVNPHHPGFKLVRDGERGAPVFGKDGHGKHGR